MQERLVTGLLILTLLLIVVAQSFNLLNFFSVKVNLILVFLVVLSFFLESSKTYLLILVLASVLSSLNAWISREFIAIFIVGLVALFLRKKFFSPSLITNAIFIVIATFILYLILSPAFIFSSIFLIELIFNEIAGAILFILFAKATGLNYKRN